MAFVVPVSQVAPLFVSCDVVAFPKTCNPLHVFTLASSVDDAAVTVIESPRLNAVPLTVPRLPVMKPAPTDVVPVTRPLASVASNAEASEEICKLVVVAFVAESEPNALSPVHVFEFANNV